MPSDFDHTTYLGCVPRTVVALMKRWFTVGAAIGMFALAGCVVSARAAGVRWTFAKFRPVSQPVAVGHRFLVYAAGPRGLQVVALDARSGKLDWWAPASPSAITPGVPPTMLAVGDKVLILRPVSGQRAKLVALDARTGHQRWASRAGYFTDWPQQCSGEPRFVCDDGTVAAVPTDGLAVLRFRVRDGHYSRGAELSTSSSLGAPRSIGPGLFDTGQRQPEVLEAASPTRRLWLRPLADIFRAPGASTDNGWDVDRVTSAGLFVGSVFAAPPVSSTGAYTFDYASQETVGLSIATGRVAWTDTGSLYVCGQPLPCRGESSSGGPRITLRLRATGTVTVTGGGDNFSVSPAPTVAVEGFDPFTGMTRWSFDAGHDFHLLAPVQVPPQVSLTVLALPNANGATMFLDLTTGTATPPTPGAVAWCRSLVRYHENVGYPGANGTITQYLGAYSFFPCDPSGHRRPVPSRVPSFVGAHVGPIAAFSDATRVLAVGR